MVYQGVPTDTSEIDAAVRRAEEALRPDVVRIRYSFGEDWTGDPSIFFKVLLTDAASRPAKLGKVVSRAELRIAEEFPGEALGLNWYTSYRSQSEQRELADPAWA